MAGSRAFLSAEWRHLLMLNYEIEPDVLAPLVPAGTELDTFRGRTLVSVVGFMFLDTRVMGVAVPLHRNFEEVNLRFYVRRKVDNEWRRGVVFIKEIVPLPWVSVIARSVYGENYIALPMGHTIEQEDGKLRCDALVEYTWRFRGRLQRMGGLVTGDPQPLEPGSEAEFITEHYWGYTRQSKHITGEYQVEHPAWRVWNVAQPYLLCDVKNLYGEPYVDALRHRPHSAFLAEGSPVKVYRGSRFRAEA